MDLTLQRLKPGKTAMLGGLWVNSGYECVTLEDISRPDPNVATPQNEAKVYGATAIPAGRYEVIINLSQRFKRMMMRLVDVPGFTGILIHSGNTSVDTHGCILVGQQVIGPDYIRGGSVALPRLQRQVQAALDKGERVWITIMDVANG